MARSRFSQSRTFLVAVALGLPAPIAVAQPTGEIPAAKDSNLEAIRKISRLMSTEIDARQLPDEMPLAKFIQELEKRLPDGKKVPVRIDDTAFGAKLADVAATPIRAPLITSWGLGTALRQAASQVKVKSTVRIEPTGIVITTLEAPQTQYTDDHDIRDIFWTSEMERLLEPGVRSIHQGKPGPAERARRIAEAIVSQIDADSWQHDQRERGSIDIVNDTKLVIRTTAPRHLDIDQLLLAMRRLADIAVNVTAKLYEVDDGFYAKLQGAKRIDLEEVERQFLDGTFKESELFKLLPKQRLLLIGEASRIEHGQEVSLLARQHVVSYLPSPDQVLLERLREAQAPSGANKARQLVKAHQLVQEGISFHWEIRVSSDRRSVRGKFTEQAAEIEEIRKKKVQLDFGREGFGEVPLVKESTHAKLLEISDGGTILIPVIHRPKVLRDKNRWWVLSVTPQIIIEEEERFFRDSSLEEIMPVLAADIIKNPRLKALREMYGTPGDKRLAMVNSALWTWPDKLPIPGYERTPANRAGNRLLGIRVDDYQASEKETAMTVSLLNAGGTANGAAVGTCAVRYRVRQVDEKTSVELIEEP